MEFQSEVIVLFDKLQIRYYGIIIVVAMLVAAYVAARLAKRDGRDPDHIWGALTWAIIPAIVCARLWFVLFPPISLTAGCADASADTVCRDTAWFFQNFFDVQQGAIAIWSGGLHIFGALIGGFLGALLYFSPLHNRIVRILSLIVLPITIVINFIGWIITTITRLLTRRPVEPFKVMPSSETAFPDAGLPIAPWLDITAVCLPLGQAIGRWANYVNQELYGSVTNLPWGIPIAIDKRVDPYKSPVDFPTNTTLFHPLFLYESLWNILAFIVLLNVYQRYRSRLRTGDIALLYIAQYAFIRFLLEFLRLEVALVNGINIVQVLCVIGFILSVGFFLYRHRPGLAQTPSTQQPSSNSAA